MSFCSGHNMFVIYFSISTPKTTLWSCNINHLRNTGVPDELLNQQVTVARPRSAFT